MVFRNIIPEIPQNDCRTFSVLLPTWINKWTNRRWNQNSVHADGLLYCHSGIEREIYYWRTDELFVFHWMNFFLWRQVFLFNWRGPLRFRVGDTAECCPLFCFARVFNHTNMLCVRPTSCAARVNSSRQPSFAYIWFYCNLNPPRRIVLGLTVCASMKSVTACH